MGVGAVRILSRARQFARLYGIREAAVNALARAGILVAGSGYRKAVSPDMSALNAAASSTHVSPGEVVLAVAGADVGEALPSIEAEFAQYLQLLRRREAGRRLLFPPIFGVDDGGAFVLYGLVRALRPATVLETGVADGHSTLAIVRALMANGGGRLVSLDVRPDAGVLLDDEEREHWSLRLVDEADPKRQLLDTLEELGTVDLFLHDSCHQYRWQMFELTATRPRMAPGGVIVCDDADDSYAFIDFCADLGTRPVMLVERLRFMGVTRVPAAGLGGRRAG